MSMAEYDFTGRPGPLQTRSARVALVASLLVHAALVARVPVDPPDFKSAGEKDSDQPLVVRLAPPFVAPSPPPAAPARAQPAPERRTRAATPPPAAPPSPAPAAAAPAPAAPVIAAPAGDFSTYLAARRSARAPFDESTANAPASPPAEDENARANRIALANLASTRQMTFGYDPSKSGGVFQVTSMSRDYGEFIFTGWNSDAKRRTQQQIEVRRGNASDIRLAIVRKMIEIIRQHEPVEFTWDSHRLGRSLVLSSRMRDNSGLEDFMMQEFFSGPR